MQPKAVLIGMPASGKTRTANKLAQKLNCDSIDLDEELVRAFGKPVAKIFEEDGERAFREKETELFSRLLQDFSGIMSVGGGAILSENMQKPLFEYSSKGGKIIYLDTDESLAVDRITKKHIENNQTRPMFALSSDVNSETARIEIQKRWTDLHSLRHQKYSLVATNRILIRNDENLSPDEVTDKAVNQILEIMQIKTTQVLAQDSAISKIFVKNGFTQTEREILLADATQNSQKIFIIATQSVQSFADEISQIFKAINKETQIHLVPDAEAGKTPKIWAETLEKMAEFKMSRADSLVAVGGGAVTDLGGFVAASFLRGINFVNIPTTLLAMVDASVGGKTGLNLAAGKNLAGAFYLPSIVICDTVYLKTLKKREMIEGLAEALKMGIVFDEEILQLAGTLNEYPTFKEEELNTLCKIILLSVLKKAEIVNQDFKESKLRQFLNYGHTFGHAVEKIENFQIRHGEAVALGMIFAAKLAEEIGLSTSSYLDKIESILHSVGLETTCKTTATFEDVLKVMTIDKKAKSNTINFVLMDERENKPKVIEFNNDGDLTALNKAFEYVTKA